LLSNVSVLAAQVSCLAGLGLRSIADGLFTTLVWVKVSASTGAVAIRRNWLFVDVVHFEQSVKAQVCNQLN
jgi:hypothetical protein